MRRFCFLLSIILVCSLVFVPSTAWIYPDSTEDGRYEAFGPRADRMLIKLYADPINEFTGLEAGELDITDWPVDSSYYQKWSSQPYNDSIKLVTYGCEFSTIEIVINCLPKYPAGARAGEDNPTSINGLRHALWHLMNRTHVLDAFLNGIGVPTFTPLSPASGYWVNPEIRPGGALEELTHPCDPTYASALLNVTDEWPLETCGDGSPDFPYDDTGWRYFDKTGNGIHDSGEDLTLDFYIRSTYYY